MGGRVKDRLKKFWLWKWSLISISAIFFLISLVIFLIGKITLQLGFVDLWTYHFTLSVTAYSLWGMATGMLAFVQVEHEQNIFKDVLLSILGKWTPPPWLSHIFSELINGIGIFFRYITKGIKDVLFDKNVRKVFLLKSLGVFAFVGALSLIYYMEHRPRAVTQNSDSAGANERNVEAETKKVELSLYTTPSHNVRDRKLQIYFSKPIWVSGTDKVKPEEVMQIIPPMAGMWKVESPSLLTFTAQNDWNLGGQYEAQFQAFKFKQGDYQFSQSKLFFKIDAPKLNLLSLNLIEDPRDPKNKKLIAEIRSSHPIEVDDLKKMIDLNSTYEKKKTKLKFDVQTSLSKEENNQYYAYFLHSEPIQIREESANVQADILDRVRYQDVFFDVDQKGKSIQIPSVKSYFTIDTPYVRMLDSEDGLEEQVLVVRSSTPIVKEVLQAKLKIYQFSSVFEQFLYDAQNIKKDVWDQRQVISWEFMPTVEDFPKELLLRIKVPQGSRILYDLEAGVTAYAGFQFPDRVRQFVKVPMFKKILNIQYQGALLARGGNKKVVVVGKNIGEVTFKLGQLLPEQIQHLISQSNGSFEEPQFNNYQFNFEMISVKEEWKEVFTNQNPAKSSYRVVDLGSRIEKRIQGRELKGIFLLEVREKRGNLVDQRLITVTDLGIIVKKGTDQVRTVFVQSLKNGKPISDANVEVMGINGLAILSGKTDSSGSFEIPSLVNQKQRAVALLVKEGDDVSYMRLDDYGRLMNLSGFDISGIATGEVGKGFSSYVFDDRGIYRPGEEVHIGYLTKDMDWKQSPKGIPVEWEMIDPKGNVTAMGSEMLNQEGFFTTTTKLNDSAPTGTYTVQLHLIKTNGARKSRSLLGSNEFQVEEFQPDTMKMNLALLPLREGGWVNPQELELKIQLDNLFGKPAINRKIKTTMTLFPHRVRFYKFKDYEFSDPDYKDISYSENLDSGETDEKGRFTVRPDLSRFKDATFLLRMRSEGFEADEGRSVVRESSTIVSPAEYMVGHKADGSMSYLSKESERNVDFIAVNSKLEQIQVTGLKLKLEKRDYQKVLVQQSSGAYAYETVVKMNLKKEMDFSISKKGTSLKIPTDEAGGYTYTLLNSDKKELMSLSFDVMGEGNLARRVERNAELELKLDREQYEQGQTLKVQIKAPYRGAGLITIERERVFAQKWFVANSETTMQEIKLPSDLEGNAYVNISYLRATDAPEIQMNPYSFGVIPFSINTGRRDISVQLEFAEESKPGDLLKVRYRADGAGKIVLYAVSEGILQLTNYVTPRPISHFFRKRRLETETYQTLDLLLPEYDIFKGLLKEGGDDYAGASDNLNPFARKKDPPIAYWSGLIDVDSKWKETAFEVADSFNGKLRVMAVASSQSQMGSTSGSAIYRGDIILTPNVPYFAGPGDEFEVTAAVANHRTGSGDQESIKVNLELTGGLEVVGEREQTLVIPEGEDRLVKFKIRATEKFGNAEVLFRGSSLKSKSASKVKRTLSVRPHTPSHSSSYYAFMPKGADSTVIDVKRNVYPEFKESVLNISPMPFALATGLIQFLDKYPYGCTEQLVSKAIPYIVVLRQPHSHIKTSKARDFIRQTVAMLSSRLADSGGFLYYPGGVVSDEVINLYASLFLVEAKEEGISLPEKLWTKTLGQIQKMADSASTPLGRGLAIYLYARSGNISSVQATKWVADFGQPNGNWNDLGAAFVASSYVLMNMDKEAASLFSQIDLLKEDQSNRYYSFYTNLQRTGGLLYLFSKHYPQALGKLTPEKFQPLFNDLIIGNYNSLSASFAMLGLDAYSKLIGKLDADKFQIKFTSKDAKGKVRVHLATEDEKKSGEWKIPDGLTQIEIKRLEDSGPLYTSYGLTGYDVNPMEQAIGRNIAIEKYIYNQDGERVTEVIQGNDYTIELTAYTLDNTEKNNVALVDILVPGFEVVTDRENKASVPGLNILDQEETNLSLDYIDAREDRILFYSNLTGRKNKLHYRVKATMSGKFKLPGTLADPMYDRLSKFLGATSGVHVIAPGQK